MLEKMKIFILGFNEVGNSIEEGCNELTQSFPFAQTIKDQNPKE